MHDLRFRAKDLTFMQGSIIIQLANMTTSVHALATITLAQVAAFSKSSAVVSIYAIKPRSMMFEICKIHYILLYFKSILCDSVSLLKSLFAKSSRYSCRSSLVPSGSHHSHIRHHDFIRCNCLHQINRVLSNLDNVNIPVK